MKLISGSIKGIIKLFLVLALFYTVFTVIAIQVSPAEVPILAFFPMGYPVVVVVLIFALPFSLYNSFSNGFLNTALLAVGFYLLVDFAIFNKVENEEQDGDLKVITYNVRNFNRWKWIEKDNVKDSIVALLQAENADVVFFQEFHFKKEHIEELHAFAKQINLPYFAYNDMQGKNDFLGLFTMSKYPLKVVDRNDFGTKKFNGNGLLVTDIFVGKDTIRACNFHTGSLRLENDDYNLIKGTESNPNTNGWNALAKRFYHGFQQKGKQTAVLAKAIDSSPYPAVLAGDANDIPLGYFYASIKDKMQDTFLEKGSGVGQTYSGIVPLLRIDYLFCSDHFEVHSHRVIHEKLSDHYPIVAAMRLKSD